MKQEALEVLGSVTGGSGRREERGTRLLRDPEAAGDHGWHAFVPACFNDALDVRQSTRKQDGRAWVVWTQGGNFAFKTGDTLYDKPEAYRPWGEALACLGFCVQVSEATDAAAAQGSVPRSPGRVAFDLLVPNEGRTGLVHRSSHVLTQDAFVRFLIDGVGL